MITTATAATAAAAANRPMVLYPHEEHVMNFPSNFFFSLRAVMLRQNWITWSIQAFFLAHTLCVALALASSLIDVWTETIKKSNEKIHFGRSFAQCILYHTRRRRQWCNNKHVQVASVNIIKYIESSGAYFAFNTTNPFYCALTSCRLSLTKMQWSSHEFFVFVFSLRCYSSSGSVVIARLKSFGVLLPSASSFCEEWHKIIRKNFYK